jgi:hypothetical protein
MPHRLGHFRRRCRTSLRRSEPCPSLGRKPPPWGVSSNTVSSTTLPDPAPPENVVLQRTPSESIGVLVGVPPSFPSKLCNNDSRPAVLYSNTVPYPVYAPPPENAARRTGELHLPRIVRCSLFSENFIELEGKFVPKEVRDGGN